MSIETMSASQEYVLSIVSAALMQHTKSLADADQAAQDVLDDLSSSSLAVFYAVETQEQ